MSLISAPAGQGPSEWPRPPPLPAFLKLLSIYYCREKWHHLQQRVDRRLTSSRNLSTASPEAWLQPTSCVTTASIPTDNPPGCPRLKIRHLQQDKKNSSLVTSEPQTKTDGKHGFYDIKYEVSLLSYVCLAYYVSTRPAQGARLSPDTQTSCCCWHPVSRRQPPTLLTQEARAGGCLFIILACL